MTFPEAQQVKTHAKFFFSCGFFILNYFTYTCQMRSIKYLNQYLIFNGNESVIYKKINEHEFVAYYDDDRGLYDYIETYEFKRYSKVNYKYIKNTEFQSVMKNKYRVEDLWEKYFVN